MKVTQLTNHKGHSHHLYFTNPGWYDGGRGILFGSDRNNRTNFYGVDQDLFASDASGNGSLHLVDTPDFEPLQGARDA